MSIVGYDVNEASHQRIALTTVEQPLLDLGSGAVDMLLERLEEGRIDARHVVLPPRLVIRDSSGPPRTRR
jgi:LacI family transcriptional regulator